MSQDEIKGIGGAEQRMGKTTDSKLILQGVDIEFAQKDTFINIPFDRNSVKKWRVKEEWFFDKQRSVMDVRIIGLAPLQENKDEITGRLTGSFSPLFWVYFPEAREILINAEVFNLVKNNAERRTYDDIFWKRMFGSTITKESSVMDRKVNEYMVGLDALLEAERIKTEIFNIEHDLWEY
jgi:gliding motility associated protien GldN